MPRLRTLQEIVLFNKTSFASRQYSEKSAATTQPDSAREESFKQACWNGILPEILPELFSPFESTAQLYMWQMRECEHMLTMEMGEEPIDLDFSTSIDPYCFLEIQPLN
jgi:hypothetical protein